jgi:hypothetical protein
MKRETLILPLNLPCLTDKAAVQLVDVLHELMTGIEHHYAAQIDRYHRRQRELHHARQSQPSTPDDPPF